MQVAHLIGCSRGVSKASLPTCNDNINCWVCSSLPLHNNYDLYHAGSSPPRDVQAFCSAIGWRMPRDPNGRIIGYDVHLNRLGAMISISGNDATFVAVEKEYQQIGTMVQVCNLYDIKCDVIPLNLLTVGTR